MSIEGIEEPGVGLSRSQGCIKEPGWGCQGTKGGGVEGIRARATVLRNKEWGQVISKEKKN